LTATDEQLLYYSALPAIAKLRWLDDAWRFTMMARRARRTYYHEGRPTQSVVPEAREGEAAEPGVTPQSPAGSTG